MFIFYFHREMSIKVFEDIKTFKSISSKVHDNLQNDYSLKLHVWYYLLTAP